MQSGVDPSNYNTIQQPEDVHHKHRNTSIPNPSKLLAQSVQAPRINPQGETNPKPLNTDPVSNIHDILDQQLK